MQLSPSRLGDDKLQNDDCNGNFVVHQRLEGTHDHKIV